MRKLLSIGAIIGMTAACYRLYRIVANRNESNHTQHDETKPNIDAQCPDEQAVEIETAIAPQTQQRFEEVLALMKQKFGEVSHQFENGEYCIETQANEGGNAISVYIGDEITLCFAGWHSHFELDEPLQGYDLEDLDYSFLSRLEGLRSNQLCAACSYDVDNPKHWCASALVNAKDLNEAEIYEEFGTNKLVKCSFWDDSKSREFVHIGEMYELTSDAFRQVRKRYPGCSLDYCLIKSCKAYRGLKSHEAALDFAMHKISISEDWLTYDLAKAEAQSIDPAEWLNNHYGNMPNDGGRIPYAYAFLEPPHGNYVATGKKQGKHRYRDANVDDFAAINAALFPEGTDELEVFEWTTDWSNYFEAGHEWWGANCWSVYDRRMNRYVVILASDTD